MRATAGAPGQPVLQVYVDQLGPWAGSWCGVQVEVGDPAVRLAQAAGRCRAPLIVVGMRGQETVVPSVDRQLVAVASVPVLIVPPASRMAA